MTSPELLDDSFLPLSDSILMDNSLLGNSPLASCVTSEHTTDSDVNSRHPLPTETLSGISNSSTPSRPVAGKSKVMGNSNFEIHEHTAESESAKNSSLDSDFAKSGSTVQQIAIEKLTQGLKEMTMEDTESTSNGSLEKMAAPDSSVSDSVAGHLNCEQSEENDILDSAIEKIDVPGQTGEPALGAMGKTLRQLIQPQFMEAEFESGQGQSGEIVTPGSEDATGSVEKMEISIDPETNSSDEGTPESASVTTGLPNAKPDGIACDESLEQSNNIVKQSQTHTSAVSKTPALLDGAITSGPTASKPLTNCLSKLLTGDSIRLRSSSDSSSFRSYFDEGIHGEAGSKKRRWSLDRNNSASQVSVSVLYDFTSLESSILVIQRAS